MPHYLDSHWSSSVFSQFKDLCDSSFEVNLTILFFLCCISSLKIYININSSLTLFTIFTLYQLVSFLQIWLLVRVDSPQTVSVQTAYKILVESILFFNMITWYRNLNVRNKLKLQRIVNVTTNDSEAPEMRNMNWL